MGEGRLGYRVIKANNSRSLLSALPRRFYWGLKQGVVQPLALPAILGVLVGYDLVDGVRYPTLILQSATLDDERPRQVDGRPMVAAPVWEGAETLVDGGIIAIRPCPSPLLSAPLAEGADSRRISCDSRDGYGDWTVVRRRWSEGEVWSLKKVNRAIEQWPGGRIQYSMGYAQPNRSGVAGHPLAGRYFAHARQRYNASMEPGVTQWYRIDAFSFQGEYLALSLYGFYRLVDASFKPPASLAEETDPMLSGLAASGPSETREMGSRLRAGPLAMSLSQGVTYEFAAEEANFGRWSTRERFSDGAIELTLDPYRPPTTAQDSLGAWRLLPDSIQLSGDYEGAQSVVAKETREAHAAGLALSLGWQWSGAETGLTLSSNAYNRHASGSAATDTQTSAIKLSQKFLATRWDVASYLTLRTTHARDADGASLLRRVAGGGTLAVRPEGAPALMVSVDLGRSQETAAEAARIQRSLGIDIGLDLSGYIRLNQQRHEPQLKVKYQLEGTAQRESGAATQRTWEHAVSVSAALRF